VQNVSFTLPGHDPNDVTRALCEYWEVRENATDAVMSLFLTTFQTPRKGTYQDQTTAVECDQEAYHSSTVASII
jgi:hypothetical protein